MGEEEECNDDNMSLEGLVETARMSLSSKKSELSRNIAEREDVAKLLSDRGDLAERQLKSLMNAYHSACSFDSTRLVETTKLRHYLSDLESKETSLRRALALLKCVSDEKTQEPSDVARGLDELSEEIKRLTECDELDIADSLSKSQSVHSLALRGHLEDKVASSAVDAFPTSEFRALLELQLQLFKDKQHIAHHSSVWALDAIIKPTEVKFVYHFFSGQPLDRADRPEWLLSFARKELEARANSLCGEVQAAYDSVATAPPLKGLSCLAYFTKCIVSLLRLKFLAWLPELLPDDRLLSAALDELLSFDAWIEERVGYIVQCMRHPWMVWPMLSDVICAHDVRFKRWLELDKKCAQEKYRTFAQVPENWKIVSFKFMEQELEVTASHPPPTYIAKSVGMMFHEMKSRYQGLRDVDRRLAYAIGIQMIIVKLFIRDLEQKMKEYDVPRVARHSYVQIREEWEKFSCILSSAEFFLDILQEVEDDVHYVELSEAAASVNQQISIGWSPPPTPVSSSLVAEDILTLKDLINIGVSDGSQACCDLIADAMFPYKRAITRSSSGIPSDLLNLLHEPCKLLQTVMSGVKVLQPVSHRHFFLAVASKLDQEFLDLIHTVSPMLISYGVEELKEGLETLANSLQTSLGYKQSYFLSPFPCVFDTLRILSLGQEQLRNLCDSLKTLSGGTDEEHKHCREALEQLGVQSLVGDEVIVLLDRALA